MSHFNTTNLMANTKQAMADYIAAQGAELAKARLTISELRVAALVTKSVELRTKVETDVREHEYETYADAAARCKALVAWDTEKRYTFVQRGTKVVCKIRATH